MKTFRLKPEPQKPVRTTSRRYISLEEYTSLQSIMDQALDAGATSFAEVILHVEYDYEDTTYSFQFDVPETDAEYAKKLEKYEVKLADYKDWCADNKKAIEARLAYKAEKERAILLKKKLAISRELDKINKDLEKL